MSETTAPKEKEEGFMSHLIEMRDRVMRMVLSVLLIFLSLFYWANEIYTYLAKPLTQHLPEGSTMIAIDVASPFLTPFKLVLMLSVFLAMPVVLHQLWSFVAPGLYKHEKRLAIPLLISSVLLFYSGIAFAYYVVFPLIFGFFTSIGPEGVAITTDIGRYLDFVLSIFFGFGLAFEVPVATIIIIAIGLTTPDKLAKKRPFVIVGAFVMGMLLTPPDVISQLLLAIPIWLLFECGLIAARYLLPEKMITKPLTEDEVENSIGGGSSAAGAMYGSDYEVVDDPADKTVNQNNETENTATGDTEEAEEFKALSDEEMDAELDRIDDDDEYDEDDDDDGDYIDDSLPQDAPDTEKTKADDATEKSDNDEPSTDKKEP